ncbi:MAG TPA: rubredoxin [Puia sp.]|uniref:rubredoxin n=1 Tax=Puia sp. TaxID=2045100 RepID=UPI002CE56A11|nr:rubredoxin [Puia sp.]HVU96681.1 rubredoxin [Puia sp.]
MFRKNYTVKINLPGGIVGAGDLYSIVEAAEKARVEEMQLGSRQQLFVKVADKFGPEFLQRLDEAGIFYETEKEAFPNIVSSYVTDGVFGRSGWVSEGLYKDILGGFDFRPGLKINLVESSQSFVPLFTGHLNFLSSPVNNHWHVVLRRPGTNRLYPWRTGIYSPDIPRFCRLLEPVLPTAGEEEIWGKRLYDTVETHGGFAGQPLLPAFSTPEFRLPYYEGFNRSGNKNWLGIYRRDELFPLAFLKDVCLIALQTKVGQLYTTPWKSLLIKGIEEPDIPIWEYVLGKYRMNVRHASNELNWQIEDLCPDGLRLKRYLVRLLDQDDIRTEGLSFAIKTKPGSGLPGSVIIRRQDGIRPDQLKLLDRYSISHTADFNPFSRDIVLYRKDLEKENLFPYLVSLCKEFYRQQSERHSPLASQPAPVSPGRPGSVAGGWQCGHCLTLYHEQYGDEEQGIPAGTPFVDIRADYVCSVCGGATADFVPL